MSWRSCRKLKVAPFCSSPNSIYNSTVYDSFVLLLMHDACLWHQGSPTTTTYVTAQCVTSFVILLMHDAFVRQQALKFAKEAVEGFEQSTAASREAALDATRQAADFSQLAHKLMRAVYKAK